MNQSQEKKSESTNVSVARLSNVRRRLWSTKELDEQDPQGSTGLETQFLTPFGMVKLNVKPVRSAENQQKRIITTIGVVRKLDGFALSTIGRNMDSYQLQSGRRTINSGGNMRVQKYHVEVKRGVVQWRYRVKAGNGEILTVSQRYFSKSNAIRAAKKVAEEMGWGLVVTK